jgi:hypothetical protein
MANSFNTSQTTITSTNSPTTVFTASASTTLVKSIRVMHGSASSSATLAITKSGGSRTDMNTVSLSANVTSDLITDVLPLASGDVITVESTHQPTYVWVSYVENTTAVNGQSIDVLNDVDTTTVAPTNGQVLAWDNTAQQWEPANAGGGAVDSVNGQTGVVVIDMDDVDDVNATSPTGGDILEWNGSNAWTASGKLNTLYGLLKEGTSTTLGDGANTNSQMELTGTTAKLKTGITEVKLTETSPGDIEMVVATDASGTTAFTALHIDGSTTANQADILVKAGSYFKIEDGTYTQWIKPNSGASSNTAITLPSKTGTLAVEADFYTDSDADARIAAASVTDLTDVTSAGSGAIITSAERTKLTGVATGATANDTDANLKNRANHTGTQTASTISDFDTEVANNTAVAANTAKTTFPGFGTSAGTALEGNTALLQLGTTSTTALAGDTAVVLSVNSETPDQSGDVSISLDSVTTGGGTLGGDVTLSGNHLIYGKTTSTDFNANGDIVKFGTGSTVQGELCYLTSSGTWVAADADATGTAGGVLLAIALGTDPDADGMLLRGMFTLDHDPGTVGDELYVSLTAGDITNDVSSYTTGDIVRVVGYCLDSTNGQIWFNPSNDFIELA